MGHSKETFHQLFIPTPPSLASPCPLSTEFHALVSHSLPGPLAHFTYDHPHTHLSSKAKRESAVAHVLGHKTMRCTWQVHRKG